jgi:hypothetical protein
MSRRMIFRCKLHVDVTASCGIRPRHELRQPTTLDQHRTINDVSTHPERVRSRRYLERRSYRLSEGLSWVYVPPSEEDERCSRAKPPTEALLCFLGTLNVTVHIKDPASLGPS